MPTTSTLISVRLSAEALAAQAADEARAPDAPPARRLIDLPHDPVTQADIDYLREDVAELAEAIGHMQRAQGPHRAHRRPPARRHFRHNHQPSGTAFV